MQEGTTARQRVVRANLGDLAHAVEKAELISPTLIFIGDVVGLVSDARVEAAAANARRRQVGPKPAYVDFIADLPATRAAEQAAGLAQPAAMITRPPGALDSTVPSLRM